MRAAALALPLLALLAAPPARAEFRVAVDRDGDGRFRIAAEAAVAAPRGVMWATLTDYDNLASFVPDMKVSRIVSAPGDPLAVHQEGAAKVLMVRLPIKVTLAVELEEGSLIRFRRIAGNLAEMSGTYRIEPGEGALLLRYEATLRPDFWVPSWIGPDTMAKIVSRQFRGLVREAERRAAYDAGKTLKEVER